MKRKLIIVAIGILVAAISFSSCKKSDNEVVDHTADIKNKTWTGEFNYPNQKAQPVSIAFGDAGTLIWYEFKGEITGSWKLENGLLTISLIGSVSFTANISNSNTLTNIKSTDASSRQLVNAELAGTGDAVLDNTKWEAPNVSVAFKPGNKLDLYFGPTTIMPTYTNIIYTRKGRAIYFSVAPKYDWFLVMSTNTVMKGLNMAPSDPTLYTFFVTKL